MATIQDIRTEIAANAPAGWEGYSTLPASANLPAIVVDLPEVISFDGSFRYATISFKVIVIAGTSFSPEMEAKLLTEAVNIAKLFAGTSGNSYRSCMVESIDSFYNITLGSKEALSASINLQVLAEI